MLLTFISKGESLIIENLSPPELQQGAPCGSGTALTSPAGPVCSCQNLCATMRLTRWRSSKIRGIWVSCLPNLLLSFRAWNEHRWVNLCPVDSPWVINNMIYLWTNKSVWNMACINISVHRYTTVQVQVYVYKVISVVFVYSFSHEDIFYNKFIHQLPHRTIFNFWQMHL